MTRRAIIGDLGGGIFGLKCSRPGYDVVTSDPDDPIQTSFYSEWTDTAKVLDIGYASNNSNLDTDNPVTDPGFIPWIEARLISGTTVYDDRTPFTWGIGGGANSLDGIGAISLRGVVRLPGTRTGLPVAYTCIYLVYNVPVPTQ